MEFLLFNLVGFRFTPNLLLILVIFFVLSLGTRYGLLTAIGAGLLRDSFDIGPLGVNVFSFMICAYITPFIRKYLYHTGSASSRLLLVFCVCLVNVGIHLFLYMKFGPVNIMDVFKFVLLPEVLSTLVVANGSIEVFRKCASRSFASLS